MSTKDLHQAEQTEGEGAVAPLYLLLKEGDLSPLLARGIPVRKTVVGNSICSIILL